MNQQTSLRISDGPARNGGIVELVKTIDGKRYMVPISVSRLMGLMNPQKESGYQNLPAGARLVLENPSSKTTTLVLEFPPAKRNIKVQHDSYVRGGISCEVKNVALPGGVFVLSLSGIGGDYRVQGGKLYGLAKPLSGLKDQLYRYPMPNLNHADGGICWGTSGVGATYKNLLSVEGVAHTYFGSNFNDHWFYRDSVSKAFEWGGIDVRAVEDFFAKLATLERFPPEWLQDFGCTLESKVRR